ncbi:bifunctional DNA primase/polymerase [Bradyrhizobium sp. 61]|uniref:bifunctional DNA primase/polymerase n=1 Tax=unclassified Bradyrhizobium TaxID=2631580 RepID=UPI001FF73A84|nr:MULTISPECIES: bifunctional DNA primase/polymerase [unclassified Bradyrhizobium]MCK1273806.1 bifunctional DNA primase/polymerase [Bradyrhizobium sp. 61]MCK1448006.1 bifunctional DNA primase/polymerase [Bradyrhizobium sp. 48]
MIDSPFTQAGPGLYENGYSPIPIMPNSKLPGTYADESWKAANGWNDYCTTRPRQLQINYWSKWPNAGVGVACGLGLICIDIDFEPAMDALLEMLPHSNVQKKGRKGISLFYRGNTDAIRSRNFRTPERVGLVDLLAEGKQTVLPPSIHPDTGEPYYWWTDDTLLDVRLDQLTELPDDIAERIGEVLKAYGYDPQADRRSEPPSEVPDVSQYHSTDFFRKLNEDALANLHAWVGKLALPKGRWLGAKYRAVAPWRSSGSGRAMAKRHPNLSFDPSGIQDFGTMETFTPINVVMKSMELGEAQRDAAVQWLGEQLGYNFGVEIDLRSRRKEAAQMAEAAERDKARIAAREKAILEAAPSMEPGSWVERQMAAGVTPWVKANPQPYEVAMLAMVTGVPATVPAEPAGEAAEDPSTDADHNEITPTMGELEALCHPPGLVGDIMDWIAASTSSPSRPLALGPALGFVGTLAGRHHAGPTNLRTNLYIVALAPAGYGKDHPRKALSRLAVESGLDRYLGPEGFLSDSALRKTIEHNPSQLSLMDEFGAFIAKIMDRRAGTHQSSIRQMLMQMFTSADSLYKGTASAAESAVPIYNPNFSIYGTSTPHDFWPSMSGKGISDGFLPRWLVLTITGDPADGVEPKATLEPPTKLIEDCRAIITHNGAGNLGDSSSRPILRPRVADWGVGAKERWMELRLAFRRRGEACSPDLAALWTRTMEVALRVAHIVAIGVDPIRPVLTRDLVDWAAKLMELSTRHCIVEVSDRLALNDKQAEYLKVRRWIKEAGSDGVTSSTLKKMVNGEFDLRRLNDITQQLLESKQIEQRFASTKTGGRPSHRWFAV